MEEYHQEAGEERKPSSMPVDLQGDSSLQVEISDAVSERDKVKFTVQTKSGLPQFAQPEFSVVRQHEEFIWLHDTYVDNEEFLQPLPGQTLRLQGKSCRSWVRETAPSPGKSLPR